MLSGESAVGKHPVEAVQTMTSIALTTEGDIDYKREFDNFYPESGGKDITSAISHATVTTAHDLNASAIITVTKSGTTARMISKFRPQTDIVGATINQKVWRRHLVGVLSLFCVVLRTTRMNFLIMRLMLQLRQVRQKGRHSCNYSRYSAWYVRYNKYAKGAQD